MSKDNTGFAIKYESSSVDMYGDEIVMFFTGATRKHDARWTSGMPNAVKRYATKEQAEKALRRTGRWWRCEVITYKEALEHSAENAKAADEESALDDAYCDDY
ncbi:hypothetical protein [Psychrobacter sp. BI730]|uniref:hypothetical protein n=1 Tax=Psychrobacter sp. BI730 TaxID=2705463 RepID=UPI0015CD303F|nr:hypothetical protein [Psychrobacter sp. BI730]NYR09571.1 hypothetical protein [Psychrobacter sp. BI730]